MQPRPLAWGRMSGSVAVVAEQDHVVVTVVSVVVVVAAVIPETGVMPAMEPATERAVIMTAVIVTVMVVVVSGSGAGRTDRDGRRTDHADQGNSDASQGENLTSVGRWARRIRNTRNWGARGRTASP